MKTTQFLLVGICAAVLAVALAGCSSGSPPSQIPINVTGTVLRLEDQSPVEGVVVILQRGDRRYQSAPSGADGTFTLNNVLAPATYSVTVRVPEGSGLRLAGDIPDQRIQANKAGFNMGTIYLTESPPGEPAFGG